MELDEKGVFKLGDKTFRSNLRLGTLVGGAFTATDFMKNYKEGDNLALAGAKSLGKLALSNIAPWYGWAQLAYHGTRGIARGLDNAGAHLQELAATNSVGFGWTYHDNKAAATMRQAAKGIIEDQQLKARYLLGNEARMMNRG
jgi:hypothetical protein